MYKERGFSMGKLFVVRHGETDFNVQGRYAGSTDIELNDNGVCQAKVIAKNLNLHQLDIIIASPLKRAHKTALIIQENIKKPLVLLDEFVERSVGVYEGLTRDEVRQNYPELWNQNVLSKFDCTLHQGESMRQVRERVNRGLQQIRDTYGNSSVVLVTHGYVSREIYRYFNNVPDEEFNKYSLGNCQVAEYDIG
jgi:probable phosphoglycerate mutase